MGESPMSEDRCSWVIKVDRYIIRVIICACSPGVIISIHSFYSQKVILWTISNVITICKHTHKNKTSFWIFFFQRHVWQTQSCTAQAPLWERTCCPSVWNVLSWQTLVARIHQSLCHVLRSLQPMTEQGSCSWSHTLSGWSPSVTQQDGGTKPLPPGTGLLW